MCYKQKRIISEYVPIEEILYADKSLGVDGAVCGFDLGYMEHRKNNVRRHKVVHFVGSADEAENWSKKIQEATIKGAIFIDTNIKMCYMHTVTPLQKSFLFEIHIARTDL